MDYNCRIIHDGSHFVATPPTGINRKKNRFVGIKDQTDLHFDQAYVAALKAGIGKTAMPLWIAVYMNQEFGDVLGYDTEYVTERIKQKEHNLYLRQRRFRQKSYLNEWNYFVTFSFDEKLMDEAYFRASLRKCLSNLHTRRGWKYMGVFEYGEDNGRLHFHALVYVPDGQMIGSLQDVRRYSTKRRKWEESTENTFFRTRFGINQFDRIQRSDLKSGKVVNYVIKYLLKSDERIIYSRAIPTEIYAIIEDQDIASEMIDFVRKFVLFDDVFTLYTEPDLMEPEVKQTE